MPKPQDRRLSLPDRNRDKALYEEQLPAYRAALHQIAQDVRLILEQHGLTPAIKYRVKSFEAYFEKRLRQDSASTARRNASLSDFFGLRIVCPFLEDIETISGLIASNFQVLETERKAKQHSVREFGYDSLHLAIRMETEATMRLMPGVRRVCEIQLRTILQDAWAEVEHELVYKSDISLPNQSIQRKLASLNATLTLSDLIFQEIRDYQKELRLHGHKRRAAVERQVLGQDLIAISHPTTIGQSTRLGPIPSTMASKLEKAMLKALEAHSNHELEDAIALYGQLLAMQLDRKTRGLVYNHRGMAHFALGQYRRAIKDFSKGIEYDPGSDRGYANRGLCFRVQKKFTRALADCDQSLMINPNRPDNFFGRAQVHFDMGNYQQALDDCTKALGIHYGFIPARQMIKTIHDQLH
jgi:putative GTP pyrophosphokinase